MQLLRRVLSLSLLIGLPGLAGCSAGTGTEPTPARERVEVFSWWAGPGEKEGFDAIVAQFTAQNPRVEFVNAAVAGGAGTNAKAVLASRLQANDPPDSYQVHAGLELGSDIRAGKVADLTPLYDREGWRDKFPRGLIDAITVDGKIYSVPVNIHRSNLLWFSPAVLRSAGISSAPKTWSEFLIQAALLRKRNIPALAIGPAWTQKHLLENVLLGELGPEGYSGLWTGRTDWSSPDVTAALRTFRQVLAVSDLSSTSGDWQAALDRVVKGAAAYTVMGDWADAYLGRSRKLAFATDYDVVTSPGSEGVFNFLSDSFTLPIGAPHPEAAEQWLMVCASPSGQDAFNLQKGSIPARTDTDRSRYQGYLANALDAWQNPATTVVGSLAHGVVVDNAWSAQIDAALARFVDDGDAARFVADATAGRTPKR